MSRKSVDLAVVVVAAVAALLVTLAAVENAAVRTLFALPLVLVLPGYALIAAAFPRRDLGVAERLAFSAGVSLAVAGLGGVVLNWTPAGLQADSWALLLGGVTLGASEVAAYRRRGQPAVAPARAGVGLGGGQWLLFGLAALVIAGAVGVATVGANRQPRSGFTQLWMTPASEDRQDAVYLGVTSLEVTAVRYELQVVIGGAVVREWQPLELAPGERWVTRVELPAPEPGLRTVEAVLYRLDNPESVYRRVQLWRRTQPSPTGNRRRGAGGRPGPGRPGLDRAPIEAE